MSWLNRRLGLYRQIAKQNAATYAKAGAMGVITSTASQPQDFVAVGRTLERMWLTATGLDIWLQPMTGMLFFHRAIENGQAGKFSHEQIQDIENAYRLTKNLFQLGPGEVIMLFRLGHGAPPTARSSRFKLEQVMI